MAYQIAGAIKHPRIFQQQPVIEVCNFRKIFSNFYPRKSKNRSGNFQIFLQKPLIVRGFLTLSGINIEEN